MWTDSIILTSKVNLNCEQEASAVPNDGHMKDARTLQDRPVVLLHWV